jgi:hypothetical protein
VDFTPEGRELRYKETKERLHQIQDLDISEEEKEKCSRICLDNLIVYEHLYKSYKKDEKCMEEKLLSMVN